MVGPEIKLGIHTWGEYKNQIIIVHFLIMGQNKQIIMGLQAYKGPATQDTRMNKYQHISWYFIIRSLRRVSGEN